MKATEQEKSRMRIYYETHKDKRRAQMIDYNHSESGKRSRAKIKYRYQTDPKYADILRQRSRIHYHKNKEKYKARRQSDEGRAYECMRRKKHPEKHKNCVLKYLYGITLNEYTALLNSQNQVCAICHTRKDINGRWGKMTNLKVDHCHKTGRVRGILCSACNTAIGMMRDDISLLKSAILYLEQSC